MKKSAFFLFILLLLWSTGCRNQEEILTSQDLDAYMTDELDRQNIPGISLLVFKGETVLHSAAYGQAHVSNNTALTEDHLFLIASISKTVTATALLQLFDAGEFGLDDPINPHLPFNVYVPGYPKEITFRNLLTHTSGIADGSALDNEYYFGTDSPVNLTDFMADYLVPGGPKYNAGENFHDFEPGSESEYSNVGSALIAVLVEEISGIDFNTYCKTNIFQPLGMGDTYWRLDEITEPIAQPHEFSGGNFSELQHYTFTDYPNGGLRTTPRDLHQLFKAFALNGQSNGFQLLLANTAKAMQTPQITDIDSETGLHFFLIDQQDNLWGHDGSESGTETIAAFNPDNKIGAIIFCNIADADTEELLSAAYEFGINND